MLGRETAVWYMNKVQQVLPSSRADAVQVHSAVSPSELFAIRAGRLRTKTCLAFCKAHTCRLQCSPKLRATIYVGVLENRAHRYGSILSALRIDRVLELARVVALACHL